MVSPATWRGVIPEDGASGFRYTAKCVSGDIYPALGVSGWRLGGRCRFHFELQAIKGLYEKYLDYGANVNL